MITKEQVKKEIDNIPDSLLGDVYSFLLRISHRKKEFNWQNWEKGMNEFTPDFMDSRNQPNDIPKDLSFEE
jgi:hypothetical protein